MFQSKLLIVAEQSVVFKPYELILKNFFGSIETLLIQNKETLQDLQADAYDILLIDLYSKKYIEAIGEIKNIESTNIKSVFVSPFNFVNIPKSMKNLQFLDLVLTKPIDFSKLYRYEEEDYTTAAQELACLSGVCEVEF